MTATLMGVSELAVLRTLERAGRRLLGRPDRSRLNDVPPWELHTHLPVNPDKVDRAMTGVWELPRAAGLPDALIASLDGYARTLLLTGRPFDRDDLRSCLARTPQHRLPWEARSE
ncbi:hypothetical protein [Streptomyces africanus]|uniref:hypothetical protein n=1 Tax=Streptomyces africanus TaxID=231024 RepID=UPI0027D7A3AB|nr:hypothetical protein [Streptomyces africanus]